MEIQFNMVLHKEDWLKFNKEYGNFINKKRRWFSLILSCLSLIGAIISLVSLYKYVMLYNSFFKLNGYLQIFNYDSSKIITPVTYLFLFAVSIYRYLFYIQRRAKKLIEHPDNATLFEEKEIKMDRQYISVQSNSNKSIIFWNSVTKVVTTKDFIAIFISSNSCLLIAKDQIDLQQQNLLEEIIISSNKDRIINIK